MENLLGHLQQISMIVISGYAIISTTISIMQFFYIKKNNGFDARLKELSKTITDFKDHVMTKREYQEQIKILEEKIDYQILKHYDKCNSRRASDHRASNISS